MGNIDRDLYSIQQARDIARLGKIAADKIANYTEKQIDKILRNMVRVAEENASYLAKMAVEETGDRKSTRLNSSHANISYAVFCLKKKKFLMSDSDTNIDRLAKSTSTM